MVILLITLVYDVKGLVDGPIAALISRATAIHTEAVKAGDAIESALAPIGSVGRALVQSQQNIQHIPEQIQIPQIQIPPLDLRIQPSVRVASRPSPQASQHASLSGAIRISPALHLHEDIGFRPTLWRPDGQRLMVVPARFPMPKVDNPQPSIPTPNVPTPVPSVRVEWHHRRVQLPAIPAATVPMPGLRQVKNLLSQNVAILGEFDQLVRTIPILETLRSYAATIMDNLQPWLRAFSRLGSKVLLLIALIVCLAAPIFIRLYVVTYVHHLLEQFRTGWALLPHAGTIAPS